MRYKKSQIYCQVYKIPVLKFEDQRLTSFSGLVLFQSLFQKLKLKEQLKLCFRHLKNSSIFRHYYIVLLLILHLLLGYRKLRDLRYYYDDPMVKRLLGLNQLPDVSTVSRALKTMDALSYQKLRQFCRELCLSRLETSAFVRITLDFDGSVLSTGRYAEGTAVGYNKKKKGARSYYPLFCTIAQTGQVFDVLHRSGNVHDSNGSQTFILECIKVIRQVLPFVRLEVRMDAAFFSEKIVEELDKQDIEFTISVPFERFTELKQIIESRQRWRRLNKEWTYFETDWKPKKWETKHRFIFTRQKVKIQQKGVLQMDLFVPQVFGYDFKVIVTNKSISAKKILNYHNGRGAQENIFAELKSQIQMDYVPVRTLVGNQIFHISAILAHNLNRELQMLAKPKMRGTKEKRTPLWQFQKMETIRRNIIQRAGRFTNPHGTLTLTMSHNNKVKNELLQLLDAINKAA